MPRCILFALAALLIAAFAGLMLTKTLPYYTFEKGIHFLTTKSDETNDNPLFRLGFYVQCTLPLGCSCWWRGCCSSCPFWRNAGRGCTVG